MTIKKYVRDEKLGQNDILWHFLLGWHYEKSTDPATHPHYVGLREMGDRWLALYHQEELTRADVSAFLWRLMRVRNEYSVGSRALDLELQFTHWARKQGISI